MKILLIGEYNALHYTLKEGLEALGHTALVVGNGDGFKKIKVDVKFNMRYNSGLLFYIKRIIYKLTKTDITSRDIERQFNTFKKEFTDYDVVQLINESPIKAHPKTETKLLQFIFDHNKNVFLLSCGTDYVSVKYADEKKFRYSILTPYFEKKGTKKAFWHALMYITPPYYALHRFIYGNIKGVIASDLDYDIPLNNHDKYLGLIPNPINTDRLKFIPLDVSGKIVIFHGINDNNYYKKGNDIFEDALKIIQEKYGNTVKIVTVRSLPYHEYINTFNDAHILLDQVYAYDQGFNALEAMAKGKVVFTGAEKEWLELYDLEEDTVAINALPDAQHIASKLEWLILNPEKIVEISKNARAFVEKEHHYVSVAEQYVNQWVSHSES
ncbi:glycosyltransferase [Bizionia gelidisalsuginis]|uniref:Glycosyltransferase n=1 Tax=Bizionia gelidisalsuginis TaxID=291188 RepID=A0ABY3MD47_9FLAO|nr:glycosyltransferase [Bizionia gelidisalsuginis]TYC16309.1 glycosyltransferase [Bizionia gelidisalsuginis]